MKKRILLYITFLLGILFKVNTYACPSAYRDAGFPFLGVYSKDGDITAIKEEVNIDLYENSIQNEYYPGFLVSNKYTFKNETKSSISKKLYIPLCDASSNYFYYDKLNEPVIKINDKEVSYNKRYAYYSSGDNSYDVTKLSSDYENGLVVNKDTTLYHYTLSIDPSSVNETKTKSFYVDFNKECRNVGIIKNTYEREIYSEEEVSIDDFRFYLYNYLTDKKIDIKPSVVLNKEENVTYYDYFMLYYESILNTCKDISEVDYINASLRHVVDNNKLYPIYEYNFKEILEYDLVLNEEEEVNTEIITPIYPSVNGEYSPCYYTFNIDLRKSNIKCSNIEVNINTDCYLTEELLFNKTDNGYTICFNDTSLVSFSFEINSSDAPVKNNYTNNAFVIFGVVIAIILVACLCVVPVLILVVIYFVKNKNTKSKLKLIYLLEGLYCIITILIMIIFSILEINILYLISIVFSLILILFLIERYVFKRKILSRIIIYIIYLLLTLLFITNTEFMKDKILISNIITFIYAAIYYIFSIKYLLKMPNSIDDDLYKNKCYYQIGYINNYSYITFILLIILTTMGSVVFIILQEAKLYFILIFILTIFIEVVVFSIIHNKEVNGCFIKYSKTLDYDALLNKVDNILLNHKLHPETRNYYYMMMFCYSITYDLDKAKYYYDLIFIPKNKLYKQIYDGIRLNYLLSFEELSKRYNEYIKIYSSKKMQSKALKLLLASRAYYFAKFSGNIEQSFPINIKNPYKRAFNMYILIFYYRKNDMNKAKRLENEFLTKYSMLYPLCDDIRGIDIREKWNNLNKIDDNDINE